MNEYKHETTSSSEVCHELGISSLDIIKFPKVRMDDGFLEFSLMQVAAWKAGLSDQNIRLWYLLLMTLIECTLISQRTRSIQ
jgi:hypothetical protein